MVGVSVVGLSIWVMYAQWGNIDKSFFYGSGLMAAMFGCFLISLSCLGCLSVTFQTKIYGFWTGRKVLLTFLIVLICGFVAEVWIVALSLSAYRALKVTTGMLESVSKDSGAFVAIGPEFDRFEMILSEKFNAFFFGAISECSLAMVPDTKYTYFWSWIEGHCDDGLKVLDCLHCNTYSISDCYADETVCYSSTDPNVEACPYTLCRHGILTYMTDKFGPVSYYILAFAIFHLLLIVITILMICYHRRDSLPEIMAKNGVKVDERVEGSSINTANIQMIRERNMQSSEQASAR